MKPSKLLEWPFLVSGMWLYFYVKMAIDCAENFYDIISANAFILGQLFPLLSLCGFLYGWRVGKPKAFDKPLMYPKIKNQMTIWYIAMVLVVIGAVGGYYVQSIREAAGMRLDLKSDNRSAYVYLLFYIGYPGLALAFWMAAISPKSKRRLLWSISIISMLIFLWPHVAFLRRGPTFPAALLLLIVPPLARRVKPKRALYLSGLAVVGILMLAYLPLRSALYAQDSMKVAISELSLQKAIVDRGKEVLDNEYINNCHMIESLVKTGKFWYGTGHLSLFFHWIPRSLWPQKPELGAGIYTHEELFDDVAKTSGLQLLGGGAAGGGVADSFVQYGYLTPVFWLILGWSGSRVYWKGVYEGNILMTHLYIAIMCASHWLVSQGLSAAFVPFMVFFIIPQIVIRLFGDCKRELLRSNLKLKPLG